MFPDRKEYEIVRIPTIPLPQNYVERIFKALYSGEVEELLPSEKEALLSHGLIERYGRRYVITDFGKKFSQVFVSGKLR